MVIETKDLVAIRKNSQGKKIVYGCGVFDLLHRGHLYYLQALKDHGDIVVVSVRSDRSVRLTKGNARPIIPEADRAAMVEAIKGIDYVLVAPYIPSDDKSHDQGYKVIIDQLQPDVFVTANDAWEVVRDSIGIEMIILPRQEGHHPSTTAIINHIQSL